MFVARSHCCSPVAKNNLQSCRFLAVPWRQFFDKLKADNLKVKEKPLDDAHERYSDDEWHWLPMGDSDIQNQASITFLSRTLKQQKLVAIKTISKFGFRMHDNCFLLGPIAVFPRTVLSWRVPTPEQITPESLELFFTLQPKLDLLVVGVGDLKNVDAVRHRIVPTLKQEKIAYEILPTEEAIFTFNYLNGIDNRYVAAALFPPLNIKITREEQYRAAIEALEGRWQTFDAPARCFHLLDNPNPVMTVCEKIWGYTDESRHAMKVITAMREEKLKMKQERLEEKIMKDKEERQSAIAATAEKRRLEAEREEEQQRKEWRKLRLQQQKGEAEDGEDSTKKIDDK